MKQATLKRIAISQAIGISLASVGAGFGCYLGLHNGLRWPFALCLIISLAVGSECFLVLAMRSVRYLTNRTPTTKPPRHFRFIIRQYYQLERRLGKWSRVGYRPTYFGNARPRSSTRPASRSPDRRRPKL